MYKYISKIHVLIKYKLEDHLICTDATYQVNWQRCIADNGKKGIVKNA